MFGMQLVNMATGLVSVLIAVAAAVLVLVWMATKVSGRARQSGIVGACMFIAGSLVPWMFSLALSGVGAAGSITMITVLSAVVGIVTALLHGAGIVLVGRAVLLRRAGEPGQGVRQVPGDAGVWRQPPFADR
jgi:hypothetical protein